MYCQKDMKYSINIWYGKMISINTHTHARMHTVLSGSWHPNSKGELWAALLGTVLGWLTHPTALAWCLNAPWCLCTVVRHWFLIAGKRRLSKGHRKREDEFPCPPVPFPWTGRWDGAISLRCAMRVSLSWRRTRAIWLLRLSGCGFIWVLSRWVAITTKQSTFFCALNHTLLDPRSLL